jgi:hypothetical protein
MIDMRRSEDQGPPLYWLEFRWNPLDRIPGQRVVLMQAIDTLAGTSRIGIGTRLIDGLITDLDIEEVIINKGFHMNPSHMCDIIISTRLVKSLLSSDSSGIHWDQGVSWNPRMSAVPSVRRISHS